MTWIKINSHGTYARIIDFGNGLEQDNIVVLMHNNPRIEYMTYPLSFETLSITTVSLNKWVHISISVTKTSAKIYIDGSLNVATTGKSIK